MPATPSRDAEPVGTWHLPGQRHFCGLGIPREHERPWCSPCQMHVTYGRAHDRPAESGLGLPVPRRQFLGLSGQMLPVSNGGGEGKEGKTGDGWQSVGIWLGSCHWLSAFVGESVSLAQPGLTSEVGLGNSETLTEFVSWGKGTYVGQGIRTASGPILGP